MGSDIEGVLAGHAQENVTVKVHDGDPWKYDGTYVCPCGVEYRAAPGIGGAFRGHRAHVAAVLREQIAEWLASAGVSAVLRALDADGYGWAAGDNPSIEEVLAALAAQVAPSRVGGES